MQPLRNDMGELAGVLSQRIKTGFLPRGIKGGNDRLRNGGRWLGGQRRFCRFAILGAIGCVDLILQFLSCFGQQERGLSELVPSRAYEGWMAAAKSGWRLAGYTGDEG